MRFEVEFVQFTKVLVDASDREEAADIAAAMDGEDIAGDDPHEYCIWDIREAT